AHRLLWSCLPQPSAQAGPWTESRQSRGPRVGCRPARAVELEGISGPTPGAWAGSREARLGLAGWVGARPEEAPGAEAVPGLALWEKWAGRGEGEWRGEEKDSEFSGRGAGFEIRGRAEVWRRVRGRPPATSSVAQVSREPRGQRVELSGQTREAPAQQASLMSFGLLRVFSIVIPFLYVGTLISKNFAALLEEHDIFVPEDDDDDD
uniref:Essential MCU regulator, mitochondrial n=1 Tax=Equus asinus TaxID=9793 RepID=A0A9L0IC89_EQUAS